MNKGNLINDLAKVAEHEKGCRGSDEFHLEGYHQGLKEGR